MSALVRVRPGSIGGDHADDLLWVCGTVAVGEAQDERGPYFDAGFDDDRPSVAWRMVVDRARARALTH